QLVMREPFSGVEEVDFAAPYGVQEVHLAPHPEPVTFPRTFPSLRNCFFKVGYPADDTARLRALVELGFHRSEPFEFGGRTLVPRDFAAAFVGSQGVPPGTTANVKRVIVEGEDASGRPQRIVQDFAVESG